MYKAFILCGREFEPKRLYAFGKTRKMAGKTGFLGQNQAFFIGFQPLDVR